MASCRKEEGFFELSGLSGVQIHRARICFSVYLCRKMMWDLLIGTVLFGPFSLLSVRLKAQK